MDADATAVGVMMPLFSAFSVQFSLLVASSSLRTHELQHTSLPCPSLTPELAQLLSIESVMPSNHLILCGALLLLPSIFSTVGFLYQVAEVLEL